MAGWPMSECHPGKHTRKRCLSHTDTIAMANPAIQQSAIHRMDFLLSVLQCVASSG
jgi:hypothetical protein